MAILHVKLSQVGLSGVHPNVIYIATNDTAATVVTAGYLNGLDGLGYNLRTSMMALVSTQASAGANFESGWYEVTYSGGNWSLASISSSVLLTNTHILVGNASNQATDVALSGDATLANTGAITIANNAITTAKILNANVTLAKLSATVAPQSIIKFASQYTTVGGAAAEAITVTGALTTDLAFVQLVSAGTNTVSVTKAVLTSNTLTVTFSGDPGNNAIINYQVTRVAT